MFVNWAHYLIPKFSFILSYLSNPLFIYLIHTNNHVLLGSYRYLLMFFAIFNMIASLADLLAPLCVHNYRYACVTFVADGPFATRSHFGENSVGYRCAFIAATYGILNVHFLFRYLSLNRNELITRYFMPYGLILSIVYVIVHWIIWALIAVNTIYSAPEMRDYVRVSFQEQFQESIDDMNFLAMQFSETSSSIIRRSWTGLLLFTVLASYSMTLYFVLGYKIITGIKKAIGTMSQKTANMQKQLFYALAIQTVIPICVSFLPCTLVFYGAAFRIDFLTAVYWGATVAISMFPFMDPIAIIFFVPALRKRLGFKRGRVSDSVASNVRSGGVRSGQHPSGQFSFENKPPTLTNQPHNQRSDTYI